MDNGPTSIESLRTIDNAAASIGTAAVPVDKAVQTRDTEKIAIVVVADSGAERDPAGGV